MIKATLILLLAHLIVPRLRGRSASERHVLWAVCLATAAVIPLLGVLLPSWQPDWAARVTESWPATFGASRSLTPDGSDDIVIRAMGLEADAWSLRSIAGVVWIAGTMCVLLVLALETLKLRRLIASARVVDQPTRLYVVACDVARDLRLANPPRLFLSARATIPLAWGVTRPSVLLPEAARDWSDDRLRAVLAHEMAHVRRGDWLVHVLAELACACYWFHPLVWTARTHVCRQSERAADDLVLSLGTSGVEYAGHLLDIVRAAQPVRPLAPTVAMGSSDSGRGSQLEARVAALLDIVTNRASVSRTRAIAIALVAGSAALPLAALGSTAAINIEIRTADLPPPLVEEGGAGLAAGATPPLRHVRVVGPPAIGPSNAPEIVEYTTPPLYSDEARRQGVEGVVTALAHIDASGAVSRVRVAKGLGLGLDQNAIVALRQWRFRPGTRAGVPEAMDVEIDIAFTLRNEAINALVANDMATLVGPGVTPPRAVRTVRATPRGVEAIGTGGRARGTVLLDVVLLEDGTPRIVRILRSLTPEADERAIRTFEQWRFSPALKNGQPVKVRMHAEVSFHG